MRTRISWGAALGAAVISVAALTSLPAHAAGTVNLYSADGLEGFYKAVLPAFEKKTGNRVNLVSNGSGALVNRMQTEKDSPKADVLITLPPFTQ